LLTCLSLVMVAIGVVQRLHAVEAASLVGGSLMPRANSSPTLR
jgi:hypothetical protein